MCCREVQVHSVTSFGEGRVVSIMFCALLDVQQETHILASSAGQATSTIVIGLKFVTHSTICLQSSGIPPSQGKETKALMPMPDWARNLLAILVFSSSVTGIQTSNTHTHTHTYSLFLETKKPDFLPSIPTLLPTPCPSDQDVSSPRRPH